MFWLGFLIGLLLGVAGSLFIGYLVEIGVLDNGSDDDADLFI